MSRGFTPIHAQMIRGLSLAKQNTVPLPLGRIDPRVTLAEGNFIHCT